VRELPEFVQAVDDGGRWNGRHITVAIGGSGKQYTVKMAAVEPCGWTYFTDESGVFFKGRALGCDETLLSGRAVPLTASDGSARVGYGVTATAQ